MVRSCYSHGSGGMVVFKTGINIMEPLKIKVGKTELEIPIKLIVGIIVVIVFGVLILFSNLTPEEVYLWTLKVLRDIKSIAN